MSNQINIQLSEVFPKFEITEHYFCVQFHYERASDTDPDDHDGVALEDLWLVNLHPEDPEAPTLTEELCCVNGRGDIFIQMGAFLALLTYKAQTTLEQYILDLVHKRQREQEAERQIENFENSGRNL